MEDLKKEFVPYDLAVKLKSLGFDKPCLASYYTDIDENNLEGKHDYRKEFNGLEYHPLDKWGTSWEPNFIRNTESVHYVSVPTFSQAFRWFRGKYGLDSFVKSLYKSTVKVGYYFGVDKYKTIEFQMDLDDYYKTYEEAELACLEKLIEIVESN